MRQIFQTCMICEFHGCTILPTSYRNIPLNFYSVLRLIRWIKIIYKQKDISKTLEIQDILWTQRIWLIWVYMCFLTIYSCCSFEFWYSQCHLFHQLKKLWFNLLNSSWHSLNFYLTGHGSSVEDWGCTIEWHAYSTSGQKQASQRLCRQETWRRPRLDWILVWFNQFDLTQTLIFFIFLYFSK